MNLPSLPNLPKFTMPNIAAKFGNGLKALPTIAFALMLGCAFVITIFVIWYTIILGYNNWPESVAEARINALAVALWIFCGGIILTLVALAFGKIEKLSVSGSVVSGEVQFEGGDDDDDDHHHHHDHDDHDRDDGPPRLLPGKLPTGNPPPPDDFVPPGPHSG